MLCPMCMFEELILIDNLYYCNSCYDYFTESEIDELNAS